MYLLIKEKFTEYVNFCVCIIQFHVSDKQSKGLSEVLPCHNNNVESGKWAHN